MGRRGGSQNRELGTTKYKRLKVTDKREKIGKTD